MLRSVHYTLKRNLTYLFTYESVKNLPKTNNGLEGEFAHLKTKLRVHSGLKLENKMSFFLIILGLKIMKDKTKNEHFQHLFLQLYRISFIFVTLSIDGISSFLTKYLILHSFCMLFSSMILPKKFL